MQNIKEILGIDFDAEIEKDPELKSYIEEACMNQVMNYEDPLGKPDAPKLNTDFKNYFIVAGMPKIGTDKIDKLLEKLIKVLTKRGIDFILKEHIEMPMEGEKTAGMAIISTTDAQKARVASNILDGYKLDKKHIFASSTFEDFDHVVKMHDDFRIPKSVNTEDLRAYKLNPDNDLYFILVGDKFEIRESSLLKTSTKDDLEKKYDVLIDENHDKHFKINKASWSAKGTYFVGVSDDKVRLLGGSDFDVIQEFVHYGLTYASVSPCERYIYTYAPDPKVDLGKYIFWRIDTGEILREFDYDRDIDIKECEDMFKWSFDGNYVAKRIVDHVAIYCLFELESLGQVFLPMMLLFDPMKEKCASIRIKGLTDFMWSPISNQFYVEFELGNTIQFKFMNLARKDLMNPRVLTNATRTKCQFSENGKYFYILKTEEGKSKSNEILVINMLLKYAIGILPYTKNLIKDVKVSKAGDRMVVASRKQAGFGNEKSTSELCYIEVYLLVTNSQNLIEFLKLCLDELGLTLISDIVWSDVDQIFLAGDMNSHSKDDLGKFKIYSILEASKDYFELNEVGGISRTPGALTCVFDPLSRFITIGNIGRGFMSHKNKGIKIFNILGHELFELNDTKLTGFLWRPRLKMELDDKLAKLFKKKYLKEYYPEYNRQERNMKLHRKEMEAGKMVTLKDKFMKFWKPLHEKYVATELARIDCIKKGGFEPDTLEEYEETIVAFNNE